MYISTSEILLLVKLFLAHILTDFVFQTNTGVEAKKGVNKEWSILKHGIITASVASILVSIGGDSKSWLGIFIWILTSHSVIDWVKNEFFANEPSKVKQILIFLADQLLHITALIFCWLLIIDNSNVVSYWINSIFSNPKIIIYATSYIFLTQPSSIIIRILIAGLNTTVKEKEQPSDNNTESAEADDKPESVSSKKGLANAGAIIGVLERIIIFTLVTVDQYIAIGFLVTAKSILRVKADNRDEEMKTEYVIVGTLLSFGIAIIVGELAKLIA